MVHSCPHIAWGYVADTHTHTHTHKFNRTDGQSKLKREPSCAFLKAKKASPGKNQYYLKTHNCNQVSKFLSKSSLQGVHPDHEIKLKKWQHSLSCNSIKFISNIQVSMNTHYALCKNLFDVQSPHLASRSGYLLLLAYDNWYWMAYHRVH